MKVKFLPQNKEFEIKGHQSVLHLAQKHGIFIKSLCNSLPSCAECRIRVIEGEQNIIPPSSKELQLIGTGHFIDNRRLSCQVFCFGDVSFDLSEQEEKQKKSVATKAPLALSQKEKNSLMSVSEILIDKEEERK